MSAFSSTERKRKASPRQFDANLPVSSRIGDCEEKHAEKGEQFSETDKQFPVGEGDYEAECIAVRRSTPERHPVLSEEAGGDQKDENEIASTAKKLRHLKLDDSIFSVEKQYSMCYSAQEIFKPEQSDFLSDQNFDPSSELDDESKGELTADRNPNDIQMEVVREGVHRCVVQSFETSDRHQVLIRASLSETGEIVMAELRDGWKSSQIAVGDIVHLISRLKKTDDQWHTSITCQDGFLIHLPDILISGSKLPIGSNCMRKGYIAERVANRQPIHHSAVMGNIMHKIMQDGLRKYVPYKGGAIDLKRELKEVIESSSVALFECSRTEDDAKRFVEERLVHLLQWLQHFADSDSGDGMVKEVVDIEECIWAPQYGLKGQIDATLSIRPADSRSGTSSRHSSTIGSSVYSGRHSSQHRSRDLVHMSGTLCPDGPPSMEGTVTVPLEFKTGRPYFTHNAQVLLYLLLMETRYHREMEEGLLWYIDKPKQMQRVSMKKSEMDSLIQARNDFAIYLANRLTTLPPMIMNPHTCSRCQVQADCAVLHKAMENGNVETAGMGKDFEFLTGHVTEKRGEFLKRWLTAIDYAHGAVQEKIPYTWHPDESQCRKAGVPGIRQLKLEDMRRDGSQWIYVFTGAENQEKFLVDDFVVVGVEGDQPAILKGYVHSSGIDLMSVITDVRLPEYWQRKEHRWRLNKFYSSKASLLQRGHIMEIITSKEPNTTNLRELIVDLRPPIPSIDSEKLKAKQNDVVDGILQELNGDQKRAVEQILQRPEYCLVHGMPGSGKTSTIAYAIKALVACGFSVLVSSHTHSAVDNILSRLKILGVDFIRIGREKSVHRDVNDHIIGGDNRFCDISTPSLTKLQQEVKVVGVTCQGSQHGFLKKMKFDVCVIDEACQIILPSLLGPLLMARSFVLVGDPMQLPPIVSNLKAKELLLQETLFSILQKAHGQAVVPLSYQYRMSKEIMDLANHLVYENQLQCGDESIAQQHLHLQHHLDQENDYTAFRHVLAPSVGLVMLDTSHLLWYDTSQCDSFFNRKECKLTVQLVMALRNYGIQEKDIGVISPYNSQIQCIRSRMEHEGSAVEISTVDKFQGRDKQCVIVSFVRSNPEMEAGALLSDWRRINVAITRARAKLILIGNVTTLESNAFLAKAIDFIRKKRRIVQLVL